MSTAVASARSEASAARAEAERVSAASAAAAGNAAGAHVRLAKTLRDRHEADLSEAQVRGEMLGRQQAMQERVAAQAE